MEVYKTKGIPVRILNGGGGGGQSYDDATETTHGLMSAADKAKLNGIENNANAYALPAMSSSTRGGAKLGDGLTVDNDVLSLGDLTHSGTGESVVTDGCALYSVDAQGWAEQDGTPTPESPVEIKVARGRNLLPNTATSQTINGVTFTANPDGTVTAKGTASATITYYLVGSGWDYAGSVKGILKKNSTYTLSGGSSANQRIEISYYKPDGTSGTMTTSVLPTVTMPDADEIGLSAYIRINNGQVVDFTFEPQLELGSTPTPYVPYGHVGLEVTHDGTTTVTPIPLPTKGWAGALQDGTADTLTVDSAGRWEWVCPTDEKVLVGGSDENWSRQNTGTANWYHQLSGMPTIGNVNVFPFATHYQGANVSNSNTEQGIMHVGSSGTLRIRYGDETSTSDFKTWLASNPVTVLYPLATPTTEHGYIDLPTLTDCCTVSIPELEGFGCSWFVEGAKELVEHSANCGKRSRYEDETIEDAIADLATRVAVLEAE